MCKTSKNLIFCTCLEKTNNAELVGENIWTLDRFIGLRETRLRGKILAPSDLEGELNRKDVIHEMNARNCFDFEYIPQERDCFHIHNGLESPDYKYFSLLYLDGKWQAGSNPAFGATISENIAKGKVKRTGTES